MIPIDITNLRSVGRYDGLSSEEVGAGVLRRALKIAPVLSAILAVLLGGSPAEARKFDFKSEVIATYFRGSYGPSLLGEGSYARSSGDGVTVDKTPTTNVSGEVGFVYATTRVNFRAGVEFLTHREMTGVVGTKADGTELFQLTSKVSAVMPMATIELLPYVSSESKVIIGVGTGIALLSVQNAYTMTTDGATYLSVGDFTEKASGQASASQIYLGYETLFTDTVTVMLDLGYRYIPVRTVQSSQDQTTTSGTYATGADLNNNDGSLRNMNLGGAFVGLGFRFYIGL